MQGIDIPVLIEEEYDMPEWFSKMIGKSFKFAMVVSYVSYAYRTHFNMPPEKMAVCREVVRRMHDLGVCHSKPIDENFLFNQDLNKAVVIDFSKGHTLTKVGEKRFIEARSKDIAIIDNEIELYNEFWGSQRGKKRSLDEV